MANRLQAGEDDGSKTSGGSSASSSNEAGGQLRVQLVEAQTHTRLMEQGALTAEETLKQMDTIVTGAVEQVTRVSAAIKTARQAMPLQQSSTT